MTAAFLFLPLLACKKAPPANTMTVRAAESALLGVWREDAGMTATIAKAGGGVGVVSLVDYDGEVFTVDGAGWEPDGFTIRYTVPSTAYAVTLRVTDIQEETLRFDWSNVTPDGGANQGNGYLKRVE